MYICTDPDCGQYGEKVNDFSWSYIEIRELGDGSYAACHAVVDLKDYTLDTLWKYCSGYYDSYEEMVATYGFRRALQVMAECVFEQLNFEEMEFNKTFETFEEANAFVTGWIQQGNQ